MTKENVLITGGAGYIGSILTGQLLDQGYRVTCLDNLMYAQKSPLIYVGDPNFEFIYGDSRDEGLLKKTISKNDVIIPLAALVGMPLCRNRPRDATEINLDAIITLNNLRNENQILIYPNTNSGYGANTGELYCTEETPLEPISIYGETKVKAEQHLLDSKKPAITLRLATVFGFSPRMRLDLLVNDFVYQAVAVKGIGLFEGDFKRNYIHIRDVSRAFLHSIENFDVMKNEPYNVGIDDANLSKRELALKIKQYIPELSIYDIEGKDPDKRNYIVSNEKIGRTGFESKFSLDDGIKELIKGYEILLKNNPLKNI
jgi:nucleoside-diphosphate-sugar epimerase